RHAPPRHDDCSRGRSPAAWRRPEGTRKLSRRSMRFSGRLLKDGEVIFERIRGEIFPLGGPLDQSGGWFEAPSMEFIRSDDVYELEVVGDRTYFIDLVGFVDGHIKFLTTAKR